MCPNPNDGCLYKKRGNLDTDRCAQREDVKPQGVATEAWGHPSLVVAAEEPT